MSLLRPRILMVTGKGGVGKTMVTATMAKLAASQGRRVLALDVDTNLEAPSVLLSLLSGGNKFPSRGSIELSSNLSCARLMPSTGHHRFLRDEMPFGLLAGAAARSKHLNRFLMAAPGFLEMGLVYHFLTYIREKDEQGRPRYDALYLDLPATGHTLAFTGLPEVILQVFPTGPVAKAVKEAQGYFYDPAQNGALVVALPEPLPVSETCELVEALGKDRVPVAGVVVNRCPAEVLEEGQKELLKDFFAKESGRFVGEWSLKRTIRADAAIQRLKEGLEDLRCKAPIFTLEEQREGSESEQLAQLTAQMKKALGL